MAYGAIPATDAGPAFLPAPAEDLIVHGSGMDSVPWLCRRYGADAEAICLRAVEADLETCALARLQVCSPSRARRRGLQAPPPSRESRSQTFTVDYVVPTTSFRETGLFLPRLLDLPRVSCLCEAARTKQPTSGRQVIHLGEAGERTFHIESLPLRQARARRGRSRVLAYLYPR